MSENIIHVTIGGETYVFDTTHPNTAISLQQLGVDLAALPNFGIHLQSQEQAQSPPSPSSTITAPAPSPSLSATPPPTDLGGLQEISFGSRSREEIRKAASTPPVTVTPPPKTPINRWGNNKPPLTYLGLITLVLEDLGGQGTTQDIIKKIRESFPYYSSSNQTTWMGGIRQCLSAKKEFTRTGRSALE